MVNKRIAYLTFDDSPSNHTMQKVDYLSARGIPAVFFGLGLKIAKNPDPMIYAIKKGFIVGNHSYSHKRFSRISIQDAKEEIRRTDEIIDDLYAAAGVERPLKIFRFPYGDKGIRSGAFHTIFRHCYRRFREIQNYLRDLGYVGIQIPRLQTQILYGLLLSDIDMFWTFEVGDWAIFDQNDSDEQRMKLILERLERLKYTGRDELIAMHDYDRTSRFFGQIIDRLLEIGFEFRAIDACVADNRHRL